MFWLVLGTGSSVAQSGDQASCAPGVLSALQPQHDHAMPSDAHSRPAPEIAARACKAWPYDPSIELAAIAYVVPGAVSADAEREIELVTAMIDGASGRVLASHRERVGEDAMLHIGQDALRLDTARYDLAPGVRAIGRLVRSDARGASCPDGWVNDQLTLFVLDGPRLRPVMSTFLDGWSGTLRNCTVEDTYRIEEATITVGLGRSRTNGLVDLELLANVETTAVSGNEVERTRHRRVRRILRHDGRDYGLDPYDNLFFWTSKSEVP